ncbi:MAG: 2-C-methyl-D-erythritol 2,4-cyclodiphosphate synthase [Verrucomicrobia bacterium]|nr:2-C-methyl-D-erythritol 2,4-cyclodiphosphate synthase [Verrucomicrobiota bacterium]
MKIRVGLGFDVHALRSEEEFYLGGIKLAHDKGTFGHSDADVLIHAICDALLGAANLRDIGYHFPPTDEQYKGIDSKKLLKKVVELIRSNGFEISNVDSTIALEKPKVNPYIEEMKFTLANCMDIDKEDISIKATTTERLGFQGREEGVSAYSVVLLIKA